ncbi:glycosidase [Asaia bogorensis NBRC 16594]|nr:glycosidase [Asaia bogorensis NBRC 16594]
MENNAMSQNGSNPVWWKDAVIYQVYPRSFADSNGDGIGDLPGIISHMPYLEHLGIDALWISPCFQSPQGDAGYDISDYRKIDPIFGTVDDYETLIKQAHDHGLRVIADMVPNHTSDQHVWFKEAMASEPGSVARARYLFRDGKGENGDEPPNNWQSVFGGIAWTREPEREDGKPRQWYLHLFDSCQPDLNWDNPEVRTEFESVLRFWLDRGVDGFRIDVAHGLIKEKGLPPYTERATMVGEDDDKTPSDAPMWDRDGVHEIYRSWHRLLASYPGDRMLVAEAWVKPLSRLARYVRPDEMQQTFNFDYLLCRWNAAKYREIITDSLEAMHKVGAITAWVMSNHDTVRHASRLGLKDVGARPQGIDAAHEQPDEALGLRRARAVIFMTLALPGSATLYQGEELGLPDHTTLDRKYRQDPAFFRTEGKEIGRDGCRIPLPWSDKGPSLGFNETGKLWLPQPDHYKNYAVSVEEKAPDSTLALYRALLAERKAAGLGHGELSWAEERRNVVEFTNGPIRVVLNCGSDPVSLPKGDIILASHPIEKPGFLPGNAAVWMRETQES